MGPGHWYHHYNHIHHIVTGIAIPHPVSTMKDSEKKRISSPHFGVSLLLPEHELYQSHFDHDAHEDHN